MTLKTASSSPAILMLAIVVALLHASGCTQDSNAGPVNRNLPTTAMQIGSERFTLEIADDDQERSVGLMNRRSMPADHGMIFVFPREQQLGFYMKDTYIPLDIVYVRGDGTIVSIHAMQPQDLRSVPSAGPAKYAIELNQGTAARVGVKPGDRLSIPPEAANAER